MSETDQPKPPAWVKPAADFGPLVVFFGAFYGSGKDLMVATGALMVATVVSVGLTYMFERKVAWVPVFTALVVMFFGGLTLWLQDDRFIKMKPTIVQAMFCVILLGGLVVRRPLLRYVLGHVLPMTEIGWRKLTVRYALFFAAMAALNEAVWRTQSDDVWVNFKIFGLLGLTMVFSLSQVPMMNRHRLDEDEDSELEAGR